MTSSTKSINRVRDDAIEASRIVGAVLGAKALLILLVGIALIPISLSIPLLSANLGYVGIAFVACAINSLVPDYVFMGYERMSIMTIRYIVCKTIGLALTFALVSEPSDLLAVPAIDVLCAVMAVIWTFLGMRHKFGVGVKIPAPHKAIVEFKNSSRVFVANFSTTLFNSFTTLVIGIVFGATEVAYWSLASTVISSVQALYSPIFNSLYVYMISQLDLMHYKRIVIKGTIAAVSISFIIALFSCPIMWILGGTEYLEGSEIIATTSPVIALSFFSIALGWPLLGAFGFEKCVMRSSLVAGLFTVFAVSCIALVGIQSLMVFAFVRCASEAVLVVARGGEAVKLRREIEAKSKLYNTGTKS